VRLTSLNQTSGKLVTKKDCSQAVKESNIKSVTQGESTNDQGEREGPIAGDKDTITRCDAGGEDWRLPIIKHLQNSSDTNDRKVRKQSLKYVIIGNEMYRRTVEGLLLKCLDKEKARIAMEEVHEGLCGTHQSAPKMKWTLKHAGLYWPTMMNDCVRYKRGCEACQRFGDLQITPASMLHPIVKPWPFRGWGLDFLDEIHPSSSKGHKFVIVSTYYFTKWTKVVPFRNMMHRELISFVQEHIIH
jgi:hypothetical protein